MAFQIVLRLKDRGDDIYSPQFDKEEAEAQLKKIKGTLGSSRDPGLDWIAVQGRAILSAHMIETTEQAGGSWSD